MTLMDAAWWGPSVRLPKRDRSRVLFVERALPGIYIVNGKGERFLNEAASYDEVGRQVQEHPLSTWVVFDRKAREKYAVGPLYPTAVMPDVAWGKSVKAVMKKADTIAELAALMDVDAAGLKATAEKVGRYSVYATGNTASSVMGRTYPGAGSTLGPAMTFGYVAAKHMMRANA